MKALIIASLVCLGVGSVSYACANDKKTKSTQQDDVKARDLSAEKIDKSVGNNNANNETSSSEESLRPPHHAGNLENRR